MPDVVDNPSQSRFEIVEDGGVAVLEYRLSDGVLDLVHTGVPKEMEGHGYASALVRTAIERARAEGLQVLPHCPYARSWIEKHPDEVEGVTVLPVA